MGFPLCSSAIISATSCYTDNWPFILQAFIISFVGAALFALIYHALFRNLE